MHGQQKLTRFTISLLATFREKIIIIIIIIIIITMITISLFSSS